MIYPPSTTASGRDAAPRGSSRGSDRSKKKQSAQPMVQWKQRNVQEGLVVVDETQLTRLIKRDPIEQHYELDPEPFATGLFASVRRCRSRDTGQHFAAKFSSRTRYGDDCSAEIHHEIALLSLCAPSPRIVRLHDVFETASEIIIVLEFAPGGDLQTIIDDNLVPFETDVIKFVQQLLEGLAYLHERKIAHLDIKPQNLVMMADFPDCDVKLCDFEISRVILEGTEIREILGTPDYVAPEILHYKPITLAADMWSLGVTTYVLLTGFSPFGGETDQETFCNISRAQLDFPEELFDGVSDDARDFIKRLLVRDPSARPTAKECLHHHWIAKHKSCTNKTLPTVNPNTTVLMTNSSGSLKDAGRSCNQKNLRKYLSKSREALFERVVQQQNKDERNSLRKNTLLSQYNKTRLCESQMSLVSKSRERLLQNDQQCMLSPSFSRSREKLYGLRSLSRSHEVLDLCKGVAAAPAVIKNLTRATTADLSMLPFWRQKHPVGNRSSTTSIPSSVANELNMDDVETKLPHNERLQSLEDLSSLSSTDSTPNTENISDKIINQDIIQKDNVTKDDRIIPALLSPTLLRFTTENTTNISLEILDNSKENCKQRHNDMTIKDNISNKSESILNITYQTEGDICNNLDVVENLTEHKECTPSPETFYTNDNTNDFHGIEMNSQIHFNGQTSNEVKIITSDNAFSKDKLVHDTEELVQEESNDSEIEEPRYTVAQLVSAFNRHQEVVTKTSLEVTMTTSDKCNKIPEEVSNSKFPTGANALRLFIPDIDIGAAEKPQQRKRHKKTCIKRPSQDQEKPPENTVQSQDTCKNYKDIDDAVTTENSILKTNNDIIPNAGNVTNEISSEEINQNNDNLPKIENVDSTNNNSIDSETKDISVMSLCQLMKEAVESNNDTGENSPKEECANNKLHLSVDISTAYLRSGSVSSDASGTPGTPSETSMSWEELTPTATRQRRRSSITTTDLGFHSVNSWGRVCTGSYTRAIEKFGGKTTEPDTKSNRNSLQLLSTTQKNTNEKVRRKSSPIIKQFN